MASTASSELPPIDYYLHKMQQEEKPKYSTAKKRMWTRMEDEQLTLLVQEFKGKNWTKVSLRMNNRSAKQCSDRWNTQLKSKDTKVNSEWTDKEDLKLLYHQKQIGNKWTRIAKHLPGRTSVSIKNRYRALSRKTAN